MFAKKDLLLNKQWRMWAYLVDLFWKLWLLQYLPTLINRLKWNADKPNLQFGELVVINESTYQDGYGHLEFWKRSMKESMV